jgi:hypothetical protein
MDEKRIPFTREDELKIASAATWGMVVSITSIIAAGLAVLAVVAADPVTIIPVLIMSGVQALLNVWLLKASLAFRKVAVTDVADQAFLLHGFRNLRAYFLFQAVMIILAVGLVIVGMCGAAIATL